MIIDTYAYSIILTLRDLAMWFFDVGLEMSTTLTPQYVSIYSQYNGDAAEAVLFLIRCQQHRVIPCRVYTSYGSTSTIRSTISLHYPPVLLRNVYEE